MVGRKSNSIQSIDRALLLLDIFLKREEIGVQELCEEMGLSVSTIRRLVSSLVNYELLEKNKTTGKFRLGPKALYLGTVYLSRQKITELANPVMKKIWDECNESVYISIISNFKRVMIDLIIGGHTLAHIPPVGLPMPLHCGASSKVLLAYADESVVRRIMKNLTPVTETTITDPDLLRQELASIKKRGYAYSDSERREGVISLAVPVFSHTGEIKACLGAGLPVQRADQLTKDKLLKSLIRGANKISGLLGYRGNNTILHNLSGITKK